MMRFGHFFFYFFVVIFMGVQPSFAQMRHGQPPPGAFDACSNKSVGAACDFQTPRGRLMGNCLSPRGLSALICVPSRGAKGQGHGQNNSGQGRPPRRYHTVIQSNGIAKLFPAIQSPITSSRFTSRLEGSDRVLQSNSISKHKTGQFPNAGNPHQISEQNFTIRVPAKPILTDTITPVKIPGWALNGVPFDPGAAEYYKGNENSAWRYEALSGAVRLGLDISYAHVQPSGKYHYHGLPTLLLQRLGVTPGKHSPLIGWAADGFPIYALYGYKNKKSTVGGIDLKTSSYRLKSGNRPSGGDNPGGKYDGTFINDYQYVASSGSLDECNGVWTNTPEYPNGTYAYFLTKSFPVVPRCVKGKNPATGRFDGRRY